MSLFSKGAQALAIALTMGLVGQAAAQRAYPVKPVHFITPYAPGGATEVIARLVGQKLNEAWKIGRAHV